jgi:predicted kinase
MLETRLLIVTGLPATGKTTLARCLADRFACPLLAKDTVKEPLLDKLGQGDAAWSRSLSDASFEVMFALVRDFLAVRVSLIVEGNFRGPEHSPALRPMLISRDGATLRIGQVLCQVDEATRLARLDARKHDPARHPGHRDGAAVPSHAARGEFLDLPGERWSLDCGLRAGEGARELLPALDRFWNFSGGDHS